MRDDIDVESRELFRRTIDRELPAVDTVPPRFPTLTRAGVQPAPDENEPLQREHV